MHRLRAEGPVVWVAALDGWVVLSRDVAVAVMRDAVTFTVDDPRFSTAQVVGPSMLSLDGAEHRRHRDPFAAAFMPAVVTPRDGPGIEPAARRLVAALAARWHGRAAPPTRRPVGGSGRRGRAWVGRRSRGRPAGLVRPDRGCSRWRVAGRRRQFRGRSRVRVAGRRAAASGAQPVVAARRRGRRVDRRRAGRQRSSLPVRRHRDQRGDDQQSAAPPAGRRRTSGRR